MIENYIVHWRTIGRNIKHGWKVVEASSYEVAESKVKSLVCKELSVERIVITDISIAVK